MTAALIYVDLEALHPVINGVWHRADLNRVPLPGEGLTMLCGVAAAAEFENLDNRRGLPPQQQCWDCDLVYRRRKGIAVPPGHGGLRPRPTPRQRDGR